MANQNWPHVDELAESGPDYVALVIEWDDAGDTVTTGSLVRPPADPSMFKTILIGAGALGALLFARWGIHRLRHG